MQLNDIAAVVVGSIGGYLLVSWAISRSSGQSRHSAAAEPADVVDTDARDRASAAPRATGGGSATDPWYEVLGVAPGASPAQITQAFERLLGQYDPDKLDGLGPELRELAEVKRAQLQAAYAQALAARS